MTIAYKPNGRFWSSRYSYDTSCFSRIDKTMLTFNTYINGFTNTQGQISYAHTDQSPPCAFYNEGSTRPQIRLTVNDNPSRNKVYRSMSLEGSLLQGTQTQFVTNYSSQGNQSRVTVFNGVTEKGGIFYSAINKVYDLSPGNNVKIVGEIVNAFSTYGGEGPFDISTQIGSNNVPEGTNYQSHMFLQVNPIGGGFSSSTSQTENGPERVTKYFIGTKGEDGNLYIVDARRRVNGAIFLPDDDNNGAPFYITNGITGRNNPQETLSTAWVAPTDSPKRVRNYIIVEPTAAEYGEYSALTNAGAAASGDVRNTLNNGVRLFLYEISEEAIDGEDAKGQYADVFISLPLTDFELLAVNVDYSPTDMDHSKG